MSLEHMMMDTPSDCEAAIRVSTNKSRRGFIVYCSDHYRCNSKYHNPEEPSLPICGLLNNYELLRNYEKQGDQ